MKSSSKACLNLIIMKNRINFSHFSILITIILLLLSSCEKNNNSACVDCYNNIVRCKINGVDWKPYCEGDLVFGCTPYKIQYYEDTKYLEFGASNSKLNNGFGFVVRKLIDNSSSRFEDFDFGSNISVPKCIYFKIDTTFNSRLNLLNLNTSKRIIKAEFNAILLNECGDTTKITDGYLDINY